MRITTDVRNVFRQKEKKKKTRLNYGYGSRVGRVKRD